MGKFISLEGYNDWYDDSYNDFSKAGSLFIKSRKSDSDHPQTFQETTSLPSSKKFALSTGVEILGVRGWILGEGANRKE